MVEYNINKDSSYFKTKMAESTLNKRGESLQDKLDKNNNKTIKSKELVQLARNNWSSDTDLGNKYKFSNSREI